MPDEPPGEPFVDPRTRQGGGDGHGGRSRPGRHHQAAPDDLARRGAIGPEPHPEQDVGMGPVGHRDREVLGGGVGDGHRGQRRAGQLPGPAGDQPEDGVGIPYLEDGPGDLPHGLQAALAQDEAEPLDYLRAALDDALLDALEALLLEEGKEGQRPIGNRLNGEFNDRDAIIYGVSTDSEYVHLAWRRSHPDLKELPFPMLADIKRELCAAFGVLDRKEGVALRATFIVDPENVIRFASVNDLNVGRNPDEVLRVLDALQTDELCPCNWQKGEAVLKAA